MRGVIYYLMPLEWNRLAYRRPRVAELIGQTSHGRTYT